MKKKIGYLPENIALYLDPGQYFELELNYAVSTPQGFALPYLLALALLSTIGFPRLPRHFRLHIWAALAINLPLFWLFCWGDELRNLSLLYPALIALIAATLSRFDGDSRPDRRCST